MNEKQDINDIYREPFKRVTETPIHWSVRFGENVRLGHNVVIDKEVVIGDNVFIGHNTVIRSGVKIGNNTTIGHLVVIEADTTIGNDVTIQSQAHITKFATIEDKAFFGPMSMCINTYHISHGRGFNPVLQGPTIKRGARIGAGSITMPGVVIGEEAELAANATATKDCKAYWTHMGTPARPTREVPQEERFEKDN